MLDRTLTPQFREIDHITLINPGHIRLDNGCNLYWFNSGEQELVRIEWIFNNVRFNQQKPLLNVAVNTMLTEGTNSLSASQIADAVDYYGAFLQVDYGFDHSQVGLYCLNKHLHSTLPVIKDIITNSVFPLKELQTFIRNQQQKLQVSLQKNDFVARRIFNDAVFGGTMYGLSPNADDYANLQRDDMVEHYRQMYQPNNCTMIVAGKVDDSTLKAITHSFDKDWKNNGTIADIEQPAVQPTGKLFNYIEKPDALQSAIRIGTPTINRSHADFPALQIVNTILGGYFGSRLMNNIREDKGYTYGIGSATSSMKYTGSIFIATEVGAEFTNATLTEIEKEVNILKTELIKPEELMLVKNYMLGSLLGSLENVFSHADKFKNVYFSGLDFAYYDRYTEVIRTITAEQILALANQYFDFDKFCKVVVGKMD
ncbi:putative Zn-dependent peptidase [Mucilaginibacter gracilis]|uniref:Putative Zn-dependent peptidase n=1 Tax=Mucilaginibacter gracilis TaxID=423350 RepID=A0A495J166_9SPHI|nr:pitrilysin family protein [Mucilaginibacter gracilis]RKR82503.1 putative Zn-dependent peptidase [Mucilaginibacter gracilis]